MSEHREALVARFQSEGEALMAQGRLRASGIHVAIVKDDAGGQYPFLQANSGVGLIVPESDRLEAEAILAEVDPTDSWRPPEGN